MGTRKNRGMMAAALFLLLVGCEDRPAAKADGDSGPSERDAVVPVGTPCATTEDCKNFQICQDGVCIPEPDGGAGGNGGSGGEGGSSGAGGDGGTGCDPACPPGFECRDGTCRPDIEDHPECDEEGAAPCPPGTVCDISADPALCRPGDGTCDDICDLERGICIDGVCQDFCFVQENGALPERCCDGVGEQCCLCDGPATGGVSQENCARDATLCPIRCDCLNPALCSGEEWAECEEGRCDCSDPLRVGNCPDDAACRCDCENPLYRRFCRPEQCEDPPPECDCAENVEVCADSAPCACDCENPLYARFCAEGQCSPPPPVCSCGDRATVHLCGNDAGCMCICGDADYGRFCSAEECMGPPPVCDCLTGQNCDGTEGCACNCANPTLRRLFCSVDDCAPECDCRTGSNCDGTEGCACNCELPAVRQLFCSVEDCTPECDCSTGENCANDAACQCVCGDPTFGRFCNTPAEIEQCNPPPECDCSTGANCSGAEGCVCQCEQSPAAQALFCSPVQRGDSDDDGISDICDPVCNIKVKIDETADGIRNVVLTTWLDGPLGEGCQDYGLLRFTGDPVPDPCNADSLYCTSLPDRPLRNRWDAFSDRMDGLFAPLYGRECMDNLGTQGAWTAYPYAIIYTRFRVGNACTVVENPGYLDLLGDDIRYGAGVKLCRRPGDVHLAPIDIACPIGHEEMFPQ